MRDIVKDVEQHVEKQTKVYPCHANRASGVGHPCERKLVYDRLNWQEALKPDVGLQLIFNEGNLQEQAVIRLLQDSGYRINESQRAFAWEKYNITGHIDGMIEIDGESYPLEVKSASPFAFDKIATVEDVKNARYHYMRGYYDQMQVYLLLANKQAGVILFKNKVNGRLKTVLVELDYEYAEKLLKKVERINEFVAKKEYPERIDDKDVCSGCPFRHICLPDETWEGAEVLNDGELESMIAKRQELSKAASEYEEVNDALKEQWKQRQDGVYLVGKFAVTLKRQKRTKYVVPKEIQEKYAEPFDVVMLKYKELAK